VYAPLIILMVSLKSLIFGQKAVPAISLIGQNTREERAGLHKAYIPKFLYKPPFGYPRFANMDYVRYLAQTPYVEMCTSTITAEIASVEWDIILNPLLDEKEDNPSERNHIKNFFLNPNSNNESYEDVFVKPVIRDLIETNTGVLIKMFNLKGEMSEIVARDAATFTKNPDIHGMMTFRDDLILPKKIVDNPSEVVNPFQHVPQHIVRETAAYFQYGWIAGPLPIPFGLKELVWLQDLIRSDDIYGYSAVQVLAKNIQTLLYMIDSDLEYFNDNNVPKGIIGIDAGDVSELNAFKDQWFEIQRTKDEFGNWRKQQHKVPIVNYIPKFERIEFTSVELELLEKQKWWTKMVWAVLGVTPVELGYTEDAKGSANQIVQSKVFRKKAINPKLRLLENRYNADIVSEFGYNATIKNEKGEDIEVPKYQFKYKAPDVDFERSKTELFDLQIKSGQRTVNEVRQQEGLDPVEWGDQPPQQWAAGANTFNVNMPGQDPNNPVDPKKNEDITDDDPDTNKDKDKLPDNEEPDKSAKKTEKQTKSKGADWSSKADPEETPKENIDDIEKRANIQLKELDDYIDSIGDLIVEELDKTPQA